MTKGVRMPGDIRVPTRLFGQFTPLDLARLGLPVVLVLAAGYRSPTFSWETGLFLVIGAAVGVVWYAWRPYGRPLDKHLYHLMRWLIGKWGFERTHLNGEEEGYVVTDDGVAVAIIEVEPVNLEMKTGDEQGALHATYRELFETVTYPVYIYSRQNRLDLSHYIEHLENLEAAETQLKQDYIEYCSELADSELTTTRHFIVLRVNPDSIRWIQNRLPDWLPLDTDSKPGEAALRSELDSRCNEVIDALNTADITVNRLTGRALHQLAQSFALSTANISVTWCNRPVDGRGEYRKLAAITEFPASMEIGWPLQLLRVDGLVDVTQVVRPRNPGKTSNKLQRLSEKLNAEIDSFIRQGYRGTNKLEGLLDDVEWMLDLLADREDQPVDYAAYVTAYDTDRERCRQTWDQVCNRLQTMQVEYQAPVFRTDQAHCTDAPLKADRLDQTLLMPAGSAAAGFPFGTQNTEGSNGVIYGVDTSDESPVLLDRFSWSSHSMARMGMVGSGKSYAAKLELLRSVLAYPNLQVFVVDPKKEYKHLIRRLDGQVFTLEPGSTEFEDLPIFTSSVVGFEVEKRGQSENVDTLVETVEGLYNAVSQNRDKTLVVVDEARILMNDEQGRQVLNQFVLEGRDTNTAVTLISQNASHFTFCREGREILDNMPGKVFMRHDRIPDSVVDYFNLSTREKQELYKLKTGTDSPYSEGILKVSGQLDTKARVESTGQEHALIETRSEP